MSTHSAKEDAKGLSAAAAHTAIESDKGSSAGKESDKGSSAGEDSVKGSSPVVNLASSGIYSEKSVKSDQDKWGDLDDEDISIEDDKGPKGEEDITSEEDETERIACAEAAILRNKRSDSIINVNSVTKSKLWLEAHVGLAWEWGKWVKAPSVCLMWRRRSR